MKITVYLLTTHFKSETDLRKRSQELVCEINLSFSLMLGSKSQVLSIILMLLKKIIRKIGGFMSVLGCAY